MRGGWGNEADLHGTTRRPLAEPKARRGQGAHGLAPNRERAINFVWTPHHDLWTRPGGGLGNSRAGLRGLQAVPGAKGGEVMTPYYQHDGITIYCGDCREILPLLNLPLDSPLVLTDPPYGRGKADRFGSRDAKCQAMPYTPIFGDDQPFDPKHLLQFERLCLWGANWYADKLPPSNGWIIWDKKDGGTSDNLSDAELAWTNLSGATRLFRHKWRGMIKASEKDQKRVHPTQKPIALMSWIIQQHAQETDLILDPYTGSGPVLKAAKLLRRRAIGIDISEAYCEIAAKGLAQEVLFA